MTEIQVHKWSLSRDRILKVYPEIHSPYREFENLETLPDEFFLCDHFGGFDRDLENVYLRKLSDHAVANCKNYRILTHEIYPENLDQLYSNLKIEFGSYNVDLRFNKIPMNHLIGYQTHPLKKIDKFLSCFNGSPHVSRSLIVAILHRMGYFDHETCTKCFITNSDSVDGHIQELSPSRERLFRKFFLNDQSNDFLSKSFEIINHNETRNQHFQNIKKMESILSRCFLNVVSETMATSYLPYVTEKLIYPIVTRTLFVAWAQPNWHRHILQFYGFRLYDKIFDYGFDNIADPVFRLVTLIDTIGKFSKLSIADWTDLYDIEKDNIEFNYDHYMSKSYWKKFLSQRPKIIVDRL